MLRISQNLSLQQKMAPQLIQSLKLLQMPTLELQQLIQQELEINPLLEINEEQEQDETDSETEKSEEEASSESEDEGPEDEGERPAHLLAPGNLEVGLQPEEVAAPKESLSDTSSQGFAIKLNSFYTHFEDLRIPRGMHGTPRGGRFSQTLLRPCVPWNF